MSTPTPNRLPRRAHQALIVLAAAVDLVRRGATLRAARLLPEPALVIDEPPPGLLSTWAIAPSDVGPLGQARALGGVRILWTPTPFNRPRSAA